MSVATGQATFPSSRACQNCATAKAKCVSTSRSDTSACERCARLKVNCEAQMPVARKLRESKARHMNRVEAKLDRIITILSPPRSRLPESDQRSHFHSSSLSSHISSDSLTRNVSGSGGHEARDNDPSLSNHVAVDNMTAPRRQSLSKSQAPTQINHEEVGALLNTFQSHMSVYFPFVILGSASTATLRTDRPFLFRAIMLAASRKKLTKQTSAGRRLLQAISEGCFLDGQTSLDLLQAILVYIGWCNSQYRNNPQISFLIQLAGSLVAELGLNKPPTYNSTKQQQTLGTAIPPSCKGSCVSEFHSSERIRAFLGYYYLNSVISSAFKKVEAMKCVPYIDECCAALEQNNEFLTDACLIKLVRAQNMLRKIEQSLPNNELEPLWSPVTPVGMVVKALETELETLFSLDMTTNTIFLLHYHYIQVSLYKIGLCEPHETPGHLDFPKMELLYSCLIAVKAYFNSYFSIPPELYFTLPATVWIQLADTIVVLSMLLLLHANGWDLSHARKLVDLSTILSRLEQNFEDASNAARRIGVVMEDEDMFHAHAVRMRWGRTTYEAKLLSEFSEPQPGAVAPDSENRVNPRDFVLYDNSFWQESLVNWDDFENIEATSIGT